MRALTDSDLFVLEEACAGRTPLDVASIILDCAGAPPSEDLPVGERDAMLIELRGLTFGHSLSLRDSCPNCGLPLQIELDTDSLAVEGPSPEAEAAAASVTLAGRPMHLRRATCADLRAALAAGPDARAALAVSCLEPLDGGAPLGEADLDPGMLDEIVGHFAILDPQSDLRFAFSCPDCGRGWTATLDIVDHLQTELRARADALLDDVHELALAYHWRESEILALSPARRNAYLERLRG